MIGIVDYGMGNLFSVSQALKRLEVPFFLSEDPVELAKADGLILPGVGAFKDAMARLNESGLTSFLHEYVKTGKPLLGICLGMQLLFEESEEGGLTKGLALLPGRVVRFPGQAESGETYKVPHMGWNRLKWENSSPITANLEEDYAYFVHSYYVKTNDNNILIGTASYNEEVPAVVGRNNVFGMQFHPEKSSKLGVELLKNFTKMV
ncbi:imidazole glycerol phosphate synthase subunit HisH [Niallia endozanthoxylica]|uniref:Imidazole glycerol phosphate synthase subunit HisH n=1 Tax=Niallia endozanthoxylica TaxID=2036016 RepID=A0A5J5HET8_9BACI|nr:imidazole glycerol phosphate synthase subunit HisH [Niallia endozanthoxylica]KAA9018004.1 imidazole glycerol phosphate synthase subunit HisH [Niallia endozanthoxylica]